MTNDLQVQLAAHAYTLEPQPYAYVRHALRNFVSEIKLDLDATDILGIIGGNAYRLLAILIPGVMAEHEFEGYSSSEAMEADRESGWANGPDNPASSPTNDQILKAIDRAAAVNRLDMVKHLKGMVGVLGEDFLRVVGRKAVLEATNSLTSGSSSLPASTGSGPSTSRTPSPSEASTGGTSEDPGDRYAVAQTDDDGS